MAYLLLDRMRALGLRGTELARATVIGVNLTSPDVIGMGVAVKAF